MFASVIIDQDTKALDKVFDYRIPSEMEVQKGDRVLVSFGSRMIQAFVVDIKKDSAFDSSKIKPISAKLDEEPIIKP